ncbi:T-cell surface glycoprotein CD8 alpha chain [Hemicordylus capensis]|uniref:T-cell surface glycoprotein CD8 alpha chain n=1 Tax=Hemicordylus capensis TaxID=884348 RepID=UPI002302850D|nr:T-cell surface glycoprotein CD8 alpha chain [Hemicordylus capensis]XP_053115395.1 T-cell surface glycoprotein CD8 alpha chain [Hemicordylus capensis]XP_053115396.1 T-cell surface glycoprotein CD8 alpha chain [Hemicordylus capensis]XP_053115397.1 T-cell surface glycoprotein CD8 alpha chain [Hemicordylus capensis]XP_053115398.1 T-cell surface glycoprotein CD8 alpha chain [Hemicordylus capensis]XP_053115399.1 T-cell surface glycoprotein CD8 alpha chain [Hemicordylus capensis]XP_053115400.1 T-
MARVYSFLCVLLMFCCCSSQTDIKIKLGKDSPQLGREVELYCESSFSETGVFWMLHDKENNPHFLLYISSRGTITSTATPTNDFGVRKSGNTYMLKVNHFKKQNEGTYYCIVNRNQALYFSQGQNVYLPVSTTQSPTTRKAATQAPNTTKNPVEYSYPSEKIPGNEGPKFFCAVYIWAPLAGGCLFLLIIFLITLSVCCDPRRRRRRCRCKRPTNGTNGTKLNQYSPQ